MTDEVDKKNPPAPPPRVRRIVRSASTQTKTEGSEAIAAPKAEGGGAAEPEAQPGGDKRIFDVRAPRAKEGAERAPARSPAERAAAAPPAEHAAAAPPAERSATPPTERAAAAPPAGRAAAPPFAGRAPQAASDRRRPRAHEPARSGPRPSFSANDPRSSRYADRAKEQRAIGTTTPEELSQPSPPASRGPGASKGEPAVVAGDDRAKRTQARPAAAAKEPSAPAAKEPSAPPPVPSPPPAPALEPALLAPMPRLITTPKKVKKPLTAKEATTARVVARAAKQRGRKTTNRAETRSVARAAADQVDSDEAPTSAREETRSEPAEAPKVGLWKRLLGFFSRSKADTKP